MQTGLFPFLLKEGNASHMKECKDLVEGMDREDLLTYQQPKISDRTPLVLTYHHKFAGIASVIHKTYNRMVYNHPELKQVFPNPPVVSYKRTKNIKDRIVRANHRKNKIIPASSNKSTRAFIEGLMNASTSITNSKSNKSCKIEGGSATDSHVIYAARCTAHDIMYVGQTSIPLNERFNIHRSDITCYPDRCELPKHFAQNGCDFNKDLQVSILEHVHGSEDLRTYKEDKWITRLGTLQPTGLNNNISEFGKVHKSLFWRKR